MKNVIDISQFQSGVNYAAAAKEIDGMIIRIGYRGWGSAGSLCKDPLFDQHVNGCINNGIPYGFYFFTQAVSDAEARAEAQYAYNIIKNYKPTFPVYIDIEESTEGHGNGRADKNTRATWTTVAKAFCEEMQKLGFTAGVYASEYWFNNKINLDEVKQYSIWCAKYGTNNGTAQQKPNISKYDAWQYTSVKRVSGFNAGIDMSYFYTEYTSEKPKDNSNNDVRPPENPEPAKPKEPTKPAQPKTEYKTYYVNYWDGLNYRATPNGQLKGTFDNGTAVEIVVGSEVNNNGLVWVKIKNGCYVAKKYLSETKPNIIKNNYKVGNVYTLEYDMKIRWGAGVNFAQKTYWQITQDGRRHAYNQNLAVLKKGTQVTVNKVIQTSANEIWLQIPSGFICAVSGKVIYVK